MVTQSNERARITARRIMYPMTTMQGSRILGLLSTNANIVRLSKTEQTRMNMQSVALSSVTFLNGYCSGLCSTLRRIKKWAGNISDILYGLDCTNPTEVWAWTLITGYPCKSISDSTGDCSCTLCPNYRRLGVFLCLLFETFSVIGVQGIQSKAYWGKTTVKVGTGYDRPCMVSYELSLGW